MIPLNNHEKCLRSKISRYSDKSTSAETTTPTSFILQKSWNYYGPHPVACHNLGTSKFQEFEFDAIYNFPILNENQSCYKLTET